MGKLRCEICGSSDIVMNESGLFKCQGCGCQYKKEHLQKLLSKDTGVVATDSKPEQLVENANTQMQLQNYREAFSTISKIKAQYPKDYRGYWLYARCLFEQPIMEKELKGTNTYTDPQGIITGAYLIDIDEIRDELLKVIESFGGMDRAEVDDYIEKKGQQIYQMLVSGEMTANLPEYHMSYGNRLPAFLKKAYNLGLANAEKMRNYGLKLMWREGDPDSYLMPYGSTVKYLLGRSAVVDDSIYDNRYVVLKKPITVPADKHAAKIAAEQGETRFVEKYKECPKCFRKLTKGFFGYACPEKYCGYKHK